ncbi:MAG TPA: hypothetical protein VL418_17770 [Devosiaceae bacterium]|nr:hypothetical protein [Devosiaceae bacterium]
MTVQREAYVLASSDTLTVIAFIVLGTAISGLVMKKTPLPGLPRPASAGRPGQ